MAEIAVAESGPGERTVAARAVDWRGVCVYVSLAFGLAWTAEGIALVRGVRFISLTP